LAALVLALAVAFGATAMAPPQVTPASAPPTEFSGARALRTIETIATRPHPTGTAAAADVRTYLVRELEALGFDVRVQDETVLTDKFAKRWGVAVLAAHVQNVVARRRGTVPGPAMLLMAHYDSRELAPGASDDGYGCATLLETARALAASPPLRHDVVLLITEGEEQGLLGARVFLERSPIAKEIALVLNFDMRGDRGPVLMFQTSDRAGALIDVLASAVHPVAASSLSQEVYRRMPNDTDLSPWLQAGYAGMNFGAIDGFARYHQPTDTPANADAATVQHMGSYALALARAFAGREDVVPASAGDAVYFTAGPFFVHYAVPVARGLAALAVGLVGIALGVGLRRKRFRPAGVVGGAATALLAPLLAGLVASGVWWAAAQAHGGALGTQVVRDVLRKTCVAGIILLGAGVAWSAAVGAMRRLRAADLSAGAMVVAAALAALTAFVLPGASYVFVWPLMASAAAWCAIVAWRAVDDVHPAAIAAHLVAPVVAIFVVVPVALQLGIAFGPAAAPALAAIGALTAATATPLLDLLASGRRWIAPASLVAGAVACVVFAAASPPFDAGSPRPDSLVYAIDADHRAWWLSFDETPDEWTGRALSGATRARFPALFPRSSVLAWQKAAPPVALEPPAVEVVSVTREGTQRRIHVHVSLPPATEIAAFDVPPEAHVLSATVQGLPFGTVPLDGWLELGFFGPPADGLDLVIVVESDRRFRLTAVAQTRGLPRELASALGPRPPDRMPAVVYASVVRASDMTLVGSSFDL
jgi:hypothetical protein